MMHLDGSKSFEAQGAPSHFKFILNLVESVIFVFGVDPGDEENVPSFHIDFSCFRVNFDIFILTQKKIDRCYRVSVLVVTIMITSS